MMMNEENQCIKSVVNPAYVLRHESSSDVARAMICGGGQTQPFYVFNMDEAVRRVQHFKRAMPRVQIFYAVKSNDTDEMLQLAVAMDIGFDCASTVEIYKIRKLGVSPKKIIFTVPCKSIEDMQYARNTGVEYTVFDGSCELWKLKESWPDAKLLIRIRVDGDSQVNLGLKFGCDFETEAISLLEEASSFGLTVSGVAFHVGSLCYSPSSYELGLRRARALFDHEAARGRRMDVVDIGGGFLSHRTDSIDDVSHLINNTLNELFPDPNVNIFAEPGGYVNDSAFQMFCRIVGTRQVIRNNVPVNMIYLNNGIHGTLRIEKNWHTLRKFQLHKLSEEEPNIEEEVILWGPTCNPYDCILPNSTVKLPKCSANDWLTVKNHGAYTLALATRFSGFPIPQIRSVVSEVIWNSLKSLSVYQRTDFILNPDISTPLLSTYPPVIPSSEICDEESNKS